MEKLRILSIGNSYSEDATRYLHQIARADNVDLTVINLYIGGCPLSLHYKNFVYDKSAYDLQLNGYSSGISVSLKHILESSFDFITVQQASHESWSYDFYQPYLNRNLEFIDKYAPKSKILVHQTWAYPNESERMAKFGFKDRDEMFESVKSSYKKAYDEINSCGIVPSGQTVQNLVENGVKNVFRDHLHVSLGVGRYALGLAWYEYITESNPVNNNFCDFDEEVTEEEAYLAKKSAHNAVCEYLKFKK